MLKKPNNTPVYNHSCYQPTNGINYQGCLYEFHFTPTERLQITYWMESFNTGLYSMADARRKSLAELMRLIGDSITGGAFGWYLERVRSAEPIPVDGCRYYGSGMCIANDECSACGCTYSFIDPTNMNQHANVTRGARILWNKAIRGNRFGHRMRAPPTNKQIEMKAVAQMGKRWYQRKSIQTVNQAQP